MQDKVPSPSHRARGRPAQPSDHRETVPTHLPTLRRVGWTLVVVGVLDIGLMIYCIANRISYSSSLNIFAVAAGILLLRGSLGTARVVTWFSAFMLSVFLLGAFSVFSWLQPLDYWLLKVRANPLGFLLSIALAVVVLGWLLWIYRQLRSPIVMEARAAAGHKLGVPTSAFVAGGALAVFMAITLQLTLKGESAEKAVRIATQQYGNEYEYFVASINWSGSHVSARLTAYNDKESKEVEVEWER